jgi:hypothetical protein
MFMKTFGTSSQGFMQRELGLKIEEDYTRIHVQLLNYDRQQALVKLRRLGEVADPPMKQSDTFMLGCLVGCMLPLLLYCFIVVVSGHHLTASPKWPFVWIHFRMTFLCILHASLWAWNIYVFKKFKINYCLIFDINPATQLQFNALLKLCSAAALWSLLWLTISLQSIVNESSSGLELPLIAWTNIVDKCAPRWFFFCEKRVTPFAFLPCLVD